MSYDNYTYTENGAVSLQSSGNPLIDFFMMMTRNITNELIEKYMGECWEKDPIKTVAIIFNSRDRINGKKEKNISNRAMIWLRNNKPLTYKGNILTYVDKYGYWKDIMYINFNFDRIENNLIHNDYELHVIANRLTEDKIKLQKGENISLCAKWAPSENDKYDKRRGSAKKIARTIFPKEYEKLMRRYREEYISPLRKELKLVETKMCENEWLDIKYENIPAVASKRLKNAFMKHDPDGYSKYLQEVKSGKKSIKVNGILPHELLKHYIDLSIKYDINDEEYKADETIEMQWKTIVDIIKSDGIFEGLLAIVDVSGSMYCSSNGSLPAQVAISLGLLITQCSSGIFSKKVITFSRTPKIHYITGDTLFEQYNCIRSMESGMDTNFEAVADVIINYGLMYGIQQNDMPKKLVCLSDMQFNVANNICNDIINKDITTLHKHIIKKYEIHNYIAPSFIYWNLNSDNDEIFPVKSTDSDTAIISGFSEQLLKIFMNNDNFTPETIFDELIRPYLNHVYIHEDEYIDNLGNYKKITNKVKAISI